jgi:hypothetical protein
LPYFLAFSVVDHADGPVVQFVGQHVRTVALREDEQRLLRRGRVQHLFEGVAPARRHAHDLHRRAPGVPGDHGAVMRAEADQDHLVGAVAFAGEPADGDHAGVGHVSGAGVADVGYEPGGQRVLPLVLVVRFEAAVGRQRGRHPVRVVLAQVGEDLAQRLPQRLVRAVAGLAEHHHPGVPGAIHQHVEIARVGQRRGQRGDLVAVASRRGGHVARVPLEARPMHRAGYRVRDRPAADQRIGLPPVTGMTAPEM